MTYHTVKNVRSLLQLDSAGDTYELTLSTDQAPLHLIMKREQLEAIGLMWAEIPQAPRSRTRD